MRHVVGPRNPRAKSSRVVGAHVHASDTSNWSNWNSTHAGVASDAAARCAVVATPRDETGVTDVGSTRSKRRRRRDEISTSRDEISASRDESGGGTPFSARRARISRGSVTTARSRARRNPPRSNASADAHADGTPSSTWRYANPSRKSRGSSEDDDDESVGSESVGSDSSANTPPTASNARRAAACPSAAAGCDRVRATTRAAILFAAGPQPRRRLVVVSRANAAHAEAAFAPRDAPPSPPAGTYAIRAGVPSCEASMTVGASIHSARDPSQYANAPSRGSATISNRRRGAFAARSSEDETSRRDASSAGDTGRGIRNVATCGWSAASPARTVAVVAAGGSGARDAKVNATRVAAASPHLPPDGSYP